MKTSRWLILFTITLLRSLHAGPVPLGAEGHTVGVRSIQAGPTPFISFIFLNLGNSLPIKSIQFSVAPKPGSITRPVSATYSVSYLQHRGFIGQNGTEIMLPVFGLYAGYLNSVTLTVAFQNGSIQRQNIAIPTVTFSDPCGFNNRTTIQARTSSTDLSFDYLLLKNVCGSFSPTIMDTDGEIRWVGTAAVTTASTVFQNAIYQAVGNLLYRSEFDGASSILQNYNGGLSAHHNIDYGKQGLILEYDLPNQVESYNMEVDLEGNVLKSWNLATIISKAMIAGGDDPSQFVGSGDNDWFHNNAVAYRRSDNSLAVSSRENFVIGIDYESGAIKWIFGDPTKQWFQFPSLRRFALASALNTLPPIGQHAVSFTHDDRLLLFDDGQNSMSHTPPGVNRTYSAPRKYKIDSQRALATEVWNYPKGETLFSPFCSSVYEDAPGNYLIDYSIITNVDPAQKMEIVGLSNSLETVFDYRYAETNCNDGWNAIPVHLDRMEFTAIVPLRAVSRKVHGAAGTFDLPLSLSGKPGVECRSGGERGQHQIVISFPRSVTVAGATVTHSEEKNASVFGPPIANGNDIIVNLSNVSNAQTIAVNLIDVSDGLTTDTISVPVAVLAGDTTGNASVNSSDIGKAQSEIGQPVTAANYQNDVTVSGVINAGDLSLIASFLGTSIGPPVETRR